MPRNRALPITDDERRAVIALVHDMRDHDGPVRLTYDKRPVNGVVESGVAEGKVIGFSGNFAADTGSVTIDTSATKGRPSTVNLVRVKTLVLL